MNIGRGSGRVSGLRNFTGRNLTNNNNGICWRCGQQGHHRWDCRQNAQANLVEDNQSGYGIFDGQGGLDEFSNLNIFMISATSSA